MGCTGREIPVLPHRLHPVDRRARPRDHRLPTIPLMPLASGPASAWRRRNSGTFRAGTIIDCRNGSPSPPCGTSPGSPDLRETGRHRASPTTRHLRAALATATLGGSHRPTGVWLPSMVRLSAPGLEFRCFQIAYGGLRCLDGRIVGVGTRASQGWTIRGRVRRLSRRIPRTGPTGVFIDPAVGQFALDAANCYTAYFRATGSPSSRVTFIAKGYLLISRARSTSRGWYWGWLSSKNYTVSPPVRIESLCKCLRVPLVISAEVARHVPERLISLGRHELRGACTEAKIFTLAALLARSHRPHARRRDAP